MTAPRLLTIEECCDRAMRGADAWLRGREFDKDDELEASMQTYGLTELQWFNECRRLERKREAARARMGVRA